MRNYKGFAYTPHHYATNSPAHTATLTTPHGNVTTPAFVFCATHATIKAVQTDLLPALGVQIILGNTYHLFLRPGSPLIAQAGGLHKFMHWNKPLFSDSGGYQLFSMGHGSVSQEIKRSRPSPTTQNSPNNTNTQNSHPHPPRSPAAVQKISERGASFRSYVDGKKIYLPPERAMLIQAHLGADLVVQLDECTPYHVSPAYTKIAMERSLRWAQRSLAYTVHLNTPQACYGVIQGGVYPPLRHYSTTKLLALDFFGLAIGGSLGRNLPEMHAVIKFTMQTLNTPPPFPVHLLGIGDRQTIFYGVRQGIATFDCVAPTRLARHGHAILPAAYGAPFLNLHNAKFRTDHRPLDASSTCPPSNTYTRAYLHHLLKAHEITALAILSQHNIAQMTRMMADIRLAIAQKNDNALAQCEAFWCSPPASP